MADKTEAAEALTAEEIAELKKKAAERDQFLDLGDRLLHGIRHRLIFPVNMQQDLARTHFLQVMIPA